MRSGFEQIDQNHQLLVEIVNRLGNALECLESPEAVPEILPLLHQYSQKQFEHEELLLQSLNYPKLESHKTACGRFKELLAVFEERLASEQSCISVDLLEFLVDWIHSHVIADDSGYMAFLRQQQNHL